MWVTHRERNRTKLYDPPSSAKTPKASVDTGHNPPGKRGRSRQSPTWSDWVWHKPRAWVATEESPVPLLSAPGSVTGRGVRPEEGVRTEGGRGAGLPQRRPGGSGGVSYLGRGGRRDFGRRARVQLRAGTGRGQPSAGGTTAACPSPAAQCGGTRARLRGPAGWVVPSGTVRVYWRRRLLLLLLLLAAPSRCSCASPCSSSCRRRRRLIPTAPIAAAATTAAPADPTRRYSPPSQPGTA